MMNYYDSNHQASPEYELDDIYALREKVSELEKIVNRQADEIACMKSAMADNLRRLQILEESKGKLNETGMIKHRKSSLTIPKSPPFQQQINKKLSHVTLYDDDFDDVDDGFDDTTNSTGFINNFTSMTKSLIHIPVNSNENESQKSSTGASSGASSMGRGGPSPRRPLHTSSSRTSATARRHKLSADSTPVRTKHSVNSLKAAGSSMSNAGSRKSPRGRIAGRGGGGSVNVSSPALNHLGVNGNMKQHADMSKSLTIKVPPLMLPGKTLSRPWKPGGTPNPETPKLIGDLLTPSSASPPFKKSATLSSFRTKSMKEPTYEKDEGILKMYIKGKSMNIYMPSFAQPIDLDSHGQLPRETLKLEWVYGYRGRDARSNIYYLPTGEIVYFVATIVILYNMEEQTQRHYLGHNDDVKSIAVHPDKITIATGQLAGQNKPLGKPHVRIWSSVNLNTLFVIGLGEFEKSVCCLAFSRADGGQYLAAVDEANEHVMSIWLWDKEKKITEARCSTEPILSADFHPNNTECLVTCGKNHLTFWNFTDKQLSRKQAIYEKSEKPKYVLCQTFLETGEVVTGDSSGNITIWSLENHKIDKIKLGAHEGPIFSLMLTKNNTILSGGGKDRFIREWDSRLVPVGHEIELNEVQGPVRMLSQGPGAMVLVGTTRNSILQLFISSEALSSSINGGHQISEPARNIVDGHTEEAWGLAVHPRQHRFVTVSNDGSLCVWDGLTRRLLWRREMVEAAPLMCVSWYPCGGNSGDILVVGAGSGNGRWLVIDCSSGGSIDSSQSGARGQTLKVHSDGSETILCVSFSPDGRLLAVGSQDCSAYVYSVSDNGTKYSRIGRCTGHTGPITHLDWSTPPHTFLRTVSMITQPPELLHWVVTGTGAVNSPSGGQGACRLVNCNENSEVRDSDWSSHTCPVQWACVGVWKEDMGDITAVGAGHTLQLLSAADEMGKLSLYTFPASHPKSVHHQYKGHSGHVTNIQFLFDDSRLISSGGKDTSVMQWEIV